MRCHEPWRRATDQHRHPGPTGHLYIGDVGRAFSSLTKKLNFIIQNKNVAVYKKY